MVVVGLWLPWIWFGSLLCCYVCVIASCYYVHTRDKLYTPLMYVYTLFGTCCWIYLMVIVIYAQFMQSMILCIICVVLNTPFIFSAIRLGFFEHLLFNIMRKDNIQLDVDNISRDATSDSVI
jgi:hypothetical protein